MTMTETSSPSVRSSLMRRADYATWGITQAPAAQSVCPGSTAVFAVGAGGAGPLTYQWQKNGVNLSDGGHYSGAMTSTLFVLSAGVADTGMYRCMVTGPCSTATSETAALSLKATTTITQHPQPRGVGRGGTATFTVAATGDGVPTYRWQKDAVDLANDAHYSGVTTATLTISNADSSHAGYYRCIVSATCGSATSTSAKLTVYVEADFDQDADVDLADFAIFQSCFNGPNRPYAYVNCAPADLDDDFDIDLSDFAGFQACFNGPNRPPKC
jgi:Immunoglobulin I-set domain